jgi:hypothetical protein
LGLGLRAPLLVAGPTAKPLDAFFDRSMPVDVHLLVAAGRGEEQH